MALEYTAKKKKDSIDSIGRWVLKIPVFWKRSESVYQVGEHHICILDAMARLALTCLKAIAFVACWRDSARSSGGSRLDCLLRDVPVTG